jgi:hypothetical protein
MVLNGLDIVAGVTDGALARSLPCTRGGVPLLCPADWIDPFVDLFGVDAVIGGPPAQWNLE